MSANKKRSKRLRRNVIDALKSLDKGKTGGRRWGWLKITTRAVRDIMTESQSEKPPCDYIIREVLRKVGRRIGRSYFVIYKKDLKL